MKRWMERLLQCILPLVCCTACSAEKQQPPAASFAGSPQILTDMLCESLEQTEAAVTIAVPENTEKWDLDACVRQAAAERVLAGSMLERVHFTREDDLLLFEMEYTAYPSEICEKKAMLREMTERWAGSVQCFSRPQQVLLAHALLVNHCDYAEQSPMCHNAYGALVNGFAACDGYTEGFALCMESLGIPCRMVWGQAEGTPHAWNLVQLSGVWYHVDCTWDDLRGNYDCFLRSDEAMQQTHAWHTEWYPRAEGGTLTYEKIVESMSRMTNSGCNPDTIVV